jgi:hypothetical protein
MRLRQLFALVLLLLALATFGCAAMSNLGSGKGGPTTMADCNGDIPSPYPPYCRPVHN